MQKRYGLLRTDLSAPLAQPTSGHAEPDAERLSLYCNSEGESNPDIDLEVA